MKDLEKEIDLMLAIYNLSEKAKSRIKLLSKISGKIYMFFFHIIQFFKFKRIRFFLLKNDVTAFTRDSATIIYRDLSREDFKETWNVQKNHIRKNLYDNNLCKVI